MAIQAYDTSGLVSGLSNEVAFVLQAGNTTITTTSTTTTQPGPDLTTYIVLGPSSGVAGGSIRITNGARNLGSPAGSFQMGLYLSSDNVITPADRRIGSRSVGGLAYLGASSSSTLLTIPTDAMPGTYYLGACVDDTNVILESHESNNCKTGNIINIVRGDPDLVVVIAIGIKISGNLIIKDLERNLGNAGTGAGFRAGLYLSTDNVIDPSTDYRIGSRSVGPLGPMTTGLPLGVTTLPISGLHVPPGKYYVGACADYLGAIGESNETNNCKAGNVVTLP